MNILKTVGLTSIILIQTACAPGYVNEQEVGTVVGSTLIGAAVGALGGAAMNPYGSGGYRGYGRYGYRSYQPNYAVNGAFAGAAAGAMVGLASVNNQRQAYAQAEAARIGSTTCSSQRHTDSGGGYRVVENCDSQVQRPGYQSW